MPDGPAPPPLAVPDVSILYRSDAAYRSMMASYEAALAAMTLPHETMFVNTRYGATHIIAIGPKDAPPFLLFHGWGANASGSEQFMPLKALACHYRVYAPDTIGQGGKSAPSRPPTKGPAYGEWMTDLLDALEIERATVMGISGGGWLALKLASFAPQRVSKVVAISTAGIVEANLGFVLKTIPIVLFPSESNTRRFFRLVSSSHVPIKAAFLRSLHETFAYLKVHNGPGVLSAEELGQISAPTLILMGEYEGVYRPQRVIERARQCIPGLVTAEIIAHAGHIITVDQPSVVEDRLMRFLHQGI